MCCTMTMGKGKSGGRVPSTAASAFNPPADAAMIATLYRRSHPTPRDAYGLALTPTP